MPIPSSVKDQILACHEHTLSLAAALDSMRRKDAAGLSNEAMTARDPVIALATRIAQIAAALPPFVP
jgi:hypothetical protein